MMVMSEGFRSTEFLSATILTLASFLLFAFKMIDDTTLMVLVGVGQGGYQVSRGLAKSAKPPLIE